MNPDELRAIISKLGYDSSKKKAFIKCPWHAGGGERTASLVVNIEGSDFPPGHWTCFGCAPKRSGNWHTLAVKLGLREGDDDEDDTPWAATISREKLSSLLSDDDDSSAHLHELLLKEPLLPANTKWRNINGWLLAELQVRSTMLNSSAKLTDYSRVYLPVWVNGKWLGGVFCSWSDTATLKYENEKQKTQKILFPYDYVKKKLKDLPKGKRNLMLVEGPRDALNPLQNDVLALANLGGDTVWSDEKVELIEDLDLDTLIIGLDPDIVGNRLAKRVKRDLEHSVSRIMRFRMKLQTLPGGRKTKEDPGNLSYERMQYLKNMMEKF
jgi:5S rRNA maturation endonuclease (ribonuclease M5)